MAPLEFAEEQPMSAVEIDASLISLQELDDDEAVKAFRARPGPTVSLGDAKKRLRV